MAPSKRKQVTCLRWTKARLVRDRISVVAVRNRQPNVRGKSKSSQFIWSQRMETGAEGVAKEAHLTLAGVFPGALPVFCACFKQECLCLRISFWVSGSPDTSSFITVLLPPSGHNAICFNFILFPTEKILLSIRRQSEIKDGTWLGPEGHTAYNL